MRECQPEIFSSLSLQIQVMFCSTLLLAGVRHMCSVLCLYIGSQIQSHITYGVRWVTTNYMQYVAPTQPYGSRFCVTF